MMNYSRQIEMFPEENQLQKKEVLVSKGPQSSRYLAQSDEKREEQRMKSRTKMAERRLEVKKKQIRKEKERKIKSAIGLILKGNVRSSRVKAMTTFGIIRLYRSAPVVKSLVYGFVLLSTIGLCKWFSLVESAATFASLDLGAFPPELQALLMELGLPICTFVAAKNVKNKLVSGYFFAMSCFFFMIILGSMSFMPIKKINASINKNESINRDVDLLSGALGEIRKSRRETNKNATGLKVVQDQLIGELAHEQLALSKEKRSGKIIDNKVSYAGLALAFLMRLGAQLLETGLVWVVGRKIGS